MQVSDSSYGDRFPRFGRTPGIEPYLKSKKKNVLYLYVFRVGNDVKRVFSACSEKVKKLNYLGYYQPQRNRTGIQSCRISNFDSRYGN